MLSSIGAWVHGNLVVEGFTASLVPVTWRLLDVAAPSAGGAVGRLVTPGGIGYDNG